MADTLLSCDWGTTNVRLRRVDLNSGTILGETASDQGAKNVYMAWRASNTDRTTFFLEVLNRLMTAIGRRDSDRAVILSGMVSSSVGMVELPYARLPFRLDGSDLTYRDIDQDGMAVLLLSGIRTQDDVLRGEETELIGLYAMLSSVLGDAPSTYILPGTHSKHVTVEGGQVTGFRTFMTGEVFEVLRQGSILGGSVEQGPFDREAFLKGVAVERPLLNALFSVRTHALFDRNRPAANFWYMSGLLVGAELRDIMYRRDGRIVLCASTGFAPVYGAALEALGAIDRTDCIDPEVVDRAVAIGHRVAYRRILEAR